MYLMKKRGLSEVVTTLIIILLVLVAIGVIWVVVQNLIKQGADEISTGGNFLVDLEITGVQKIPGDELYQVSVTRNPGAGNLEGLMFIFEGGGKTDSIKNNTALGELDSEIFAVTNNSAYNNAILYDLGGSALEKVSVAPIFKGGKVGTITDTYVVSSGSGGTTPAVPNYLAHWEFNGDALDASGNGNNGTLLGGAQVSSGFLDLVSSPVTSYFSAFGPDIEGRNNLTFESKIYLESLPSSVGFITYKSQGLGVEGFRVYVNSLGNVTAFADGAVACVMVQTPSLIESQTWYDLKVVYNGTLPANNGAIKIYLDNSPVTSASLSACSSLSPPGNLRNTNSDLLLGTSDSENPSATHFTGYLDEVKFY